MPVAIVNVCVDPRLNHEVIRAQVRARLEELGRAAQRVFIVNDVGGNIGSAFRNTLDLARRSREEVVLAAVLHHDDCLAEQAGLRRPLEESIREVRTLLGRGSRDTPVLSGQILTETSAIVWDDKPKRPGDLLGFRMPRLSL